MRILLVHNFYQIPGGEDSVVRDEMAMLERNGIEVDLFSVTNDAIAGGAKKIAAALQVIYNPWARLALSEKLADFRPDVVHIHNFFPLLSPSILDACAAARIPAVMTLHNFRILSPAALLHPVEQSRLRHPRQSCWWTVPKKVYRDSAIGTLAVAAMIEFHKKRRTWARKVDRFVVLSETAKRVFAEAGLPSERITVKPNCTARPKEVRDLPREGALFVGRLDQQKGTETLLRAWQHIDYPIKIIGDGPLSEMAARSGNPNIRCLGRQSREVVQREMQMAKFLVLPSTGPEMFPMTIVEAFSNGLPVICSALPSLAELVEPGLSGLLFTPSDADALAREVRWAIANPSKLEAFGRNARAVYEARFTPEINFRHLSGLYQSLCHDGGAAERRRPEQASYA